MLIWSSTLQLLHAYSPNRCQMFPAFQQILRNWLDMGQPNIPPANAPQQRTRIYKLIPFPTIDEFRAAAENWNEVVAGKLQYAFGGTFVALHRGGQVEARNIEIILQQGGLQQTSQIKTDNPQFLGITEHNDHIIVVREEGVYSFGVAIRCYELGTEGFPYRFIPPYESPHRTAEDGTLEPTFYEQGLQVQIHHGSIPILRSKYLLYQRLFRFNRDYFATQNWEQKHLRRDIHDIRVFLHCAAFDQEKPFSDDIVPQLTQVVRIWKKFAENNFVDTTAEDVDAWNRLGVPLSPFHDVSAIHGQN